MLLPVHRSSFHSCSLCLPVCFVISFDTVDHSGLGNCQISCLYLGSTTYFKSALEKLCGVPCCLVFSYDVTYVKNAVRVLSKNFQRIEYLGNTSCYCLVMPEMCPSLVSKSMRR